MLAIRTENLTKDFRVGFWRPRPYRALDRLNLEVAQGETFGFLGPNGAGKTTTLKLLLQLIFPTSGSAEILGKPVGDVGVKRRIGYLPESPYFYDYLTAEELLTYFADLLGYVGRERTEPISHSSHSREWRTSTRTICGATATASANWLTVCLAASRRRA